MPHSFFVLLCSFKLIICKFGENGIRRLLVASPVLPSLLVGKLKYATF